MAGYYLKLAGYYLDRAVTAVFVLWAGPPPTGEYMVGDRPIKPHRGAGTIREEDAKPEPDDADEK
jgi:hypothetical protein